MAYELMEDPSSLTDTTFWTFTTEYGDLDVVLRPAGFPQGYDDLVDGVVIVRLVDEERSEPGGRRCRSRVSAIYTSKRLAGRQKDIESLPAFTGIHPIECKGSRAPAIPGRSGLAVAASDPGKLSDGRDDPSAREPCFIAGLSRGPSRPWLSALEETLCSSATSVHTSPPKSQDSELEGLVSARTWGFKSPLRHQKSPGRRHNFGLGDPTRMTFQAARVVPIWLTETG